MPKPAILFINRVYPPRKGATGRLLRDLAQSFAQNGWDVAVVTTGPRDEILKDGPVTIHCVRAAQKKTIPNYAWTAFRLYKAARKFRQLNLIVTMTDPPLLVVAGRMLAARRKIPHIHWCHDLYPDVLPALGIKFPRFIMDFLKRASRRSLKSCNHVIVVGRCMAKYLVQTGMDSRRMTFIPNWPDREFSSAAENPGYETRQPAKPLIRDTERKFRVLHAGNLGLAHPLETILEAAVLLQASNPEIEFIFVGEGPGHDRLAAERTRRGLQNIRLLPTQPAFQLREMMQGGDLHLISLTHDAAGMVVPSKLYSALASERPCIFVGPEQSETARVLTEYNAGSVLPQGDARLLADTIAAYRMDGNKWFTAHKGASRAHEDFNAATSIQRWIECAKATIGYPVS